MCLPDGSLLGPNAYTLDIIGSFAQLLQFVEDGMRCFHSGLSVELSGVRNLEQDVLHDVRSVFHLELERLALGIEN